MKYGVVTFSYAGFAHFRDSLATSGSYSANLGDNVQTIAARRAYRGLGVDRSDIIDIDRDTLPNYNGPPAYLIMNAVFTSTTLPAPPQITPIFIGFSADATTIDTHLPWLSSHAPIGCRDVATAQRLTERGVDAYVSGCISMTLDRRPSAPPAGRLLIVYGSGAGVLPPSVLHHIPSHLLENAEFVFHRLPVDEHPLSLDRRAFLERYEETLLRRYSDEAAIVLTPLLHVASPCLGLGVPVILCRKDRGGRFSFIETQIPVYTPDQVASIEWQPAPVDIQAFSEALLRRLFGVIHPHLGAVARQALVR